MGKRGYGKEIDGIRRTLMGMCGILPHNPPVTALPCQPPLHKGAFGAMEWGGNPSVKNRRFLTAPLGGEPLGAVGNLGAAA